MLRNFSTAVLPSMCAVGDLLVRGRADSPFSPGKVYDRLWVTGVRSERGKVDSHLSHERQIHRVTVLRGNIWKFTSLKDSLKVY